MKKLQPFVRRVLQRLLQAEDEEPDPWLRDDIQIARLTVSYAASGEARPCLPQVLASYEVLGLHPEKVWPATVARLKAQLGPHYEEFYDSDGNWIPDPAIHWLAERAPKKPPQSVKLWQFKANGARAVNSCPAYNMMDSTAEAYPIPDVRGSVKSRRYFNRETISDLLLSLPCKPKLKYTAYKIWVSATKPQGTEIRCFKTMKQYAKAAEVCERTLRYHMRQLERLFGVCEEHDDGADPRCDQCRAVALFQLDHRANTKVRRPSTHRLNLERLQHPHRIDGRCAVCLHEHLSNEECGCELQSRHSYKRQCRCQVPQHRKVTEFPRKPTPPDPKPPAPATPAPTWERPAADHRGTRRITRDERVALFSTYIALKKTGMAHEAAIGEVNRQFKNRYSADDIEFAVKIVESKPSGSKADEEDYRRLMRAIALERQNAGTGQNPFDAACRKCGLSLERGSELWNRFNEPDSSA